MKKYYVLCCFLLLSFFTAIKAEKSDDDDDDDDADDDDEADENVESSTQILQNVSSGALAKIPTKSAKSEAGEKKSNEQTKDLVKNYGTDEQSLIWEMQQQISKLTNNQLENSNSRMKCVSCYSKWTSTSESCYRGTVTTLVKCAQSEICVTELHPRYIKRGCMLPSKLNMTFVCKCPLCNDKPYNDSTYYTYESVMDWRYDNERLQVPTGTHLLCKVCKMSNNTEVDNECKAGNRSDYKICGHKQLCYTNVNYLDNSVSRGCIDPPAYNTLHKFCNYSGCNNVEYYDPVKSTIRFRRHNLPMSDLYSNATIFGISQYSYIMFAILCLFIPYEQM